MSIQSMDSQSFSWGHTKSHVASDEFLIHAHPFYELYYFVSGDVDYLLGGVEYKLKPGTLLIIQPNEFHGLRVNSTEEYDRWTLHFVSDLISVDRRALLLPALNVRRNDERCIEDDGGLLETFRAVDDLFTLPQTTRDQLVPVVLENILARILTYQYRSHTEEIVQETDTRPSDAILQIAAYLNEHFMDKITLDMLAEKFYISKSHLNLSFRKTMGTTVIDYLLVKRVTYAQQLLINGQSASQAAIAAGFGDYTSFYRAYVKHFGRSPTQDRRKGEGVRQLLLSEECPKHSGDATGSLWARLPGVSASPGRTSMLCDSGSSGCCP